MDRLPKPAAADDAATKTFRDDLPSSGESAPEIEGQAMGDDHWWRVIE